jgi:hypothetical protein
MTVRYSCHFIWRRQQRWWRAAKLGHTLTIYGILEQWGVIIVPHLLWHWASVSATVLSEGLPHLLLQGRDAEDGSFLTRIQTGLIMCEGKLDVILTSKWFFRILISSVIWYTQKVHNPRIGIIVSVTIFINWIRFPKPRFDVKEYWQKLPRKTYGEN